VDLDPVLGYLHRGVEKLCENGTGTTPSARCDPLEYVSLAVQRGSPVMAFEKLLDVQVPRRAEYIRVLVRELNRIASHALFIGWLALDLGGLTPILYGFIERDEIVEMLAALTGQRDALQLPPHRRRQRRPEPRVHEPPGRLDEPRRAPARATGALLNENEIFVRRTRGLGVLDRETALRMCVTGPEPARVRRALRRPPRAPVQRLPGARVRHPGARTEGDSLARYLLRTRRGPQSLRIIDQCLHDMPDGPIMAKVPRLLRRAAGRAFAAIEARAASTRVRDQRRLRPAVPAAHPRSVVRATCSWWAC
jgi:NADH-quinone oxidoreductase subunit D